MDHVETIKALSADLKQKAKQIQAAMDERNKADIALKTSYETEAKKLDSIAKNLSNPVTAIKKTRPKRKPQTE